jgi:F0F1-type ATP synthase gamma subunit
MEYVNKNQQNTDAVIVGKLGLRMLTDRNINLLYNYFDFPDDKIDFDAVNTIMRYLLQYERIVVFHGQFKNLVVQNPVATGVSGHDLIIDMSNKSNEADMTNHGLYLFEPSLKEVLQVFEGEILSSIFAQAMHESQLAKFASRLFNLDRSMESINNRSDDLLVLRRRLDRQSAGRRQLGRIAGMSLWS